MRVSGLVQFHTDLEPLLVDIDSITQHPDNPNNGDVDAISESIEVNGYIAPIIAQRSTGHILAGNHRWEALKQLGATEAPVIMVDLDDASALRYLIGDNRLAALAKLDHSRLLPLLRQMEEKGDLLGSGYSAYDIEAIAHLQKIPLEYEDFAQWPTLTFQVPPHVRQAFLTMTEVAVGDRERFELLLRLAGWDGKKVQI